MTQTDLQQPELSSRATTWQVMSTWLTFAPMVVATIVAMIASIHSMRVRLTMPYPQTPWETSIVADAWRYAHHQPIFEKIPAGHATHMYGPLTSIAIGIIFKLTHSTNLYTGRTLTLCCALISCAILLLTFARRKNPLTLLLGAGLLLALHYRGRAYFVESRPDMVALLLVTLALLLMYRAHVRLVPWLYIPGTILMTSAMLFKQTYAAAAAVPLLAVLITSDFPRTRWANIRFNVLLALIPLAACAGTISLLKVLAPNVYFYMMTVPTMVQLRPERFGLGVISTLTLAPLFVAMAMWYVLMPRDPQLRTTKIMWLIAATIVGCTAGLLPFAKRGGSYNSLLLGWVPATAFCIAMLDPLIRRLNSLRGKMSGIIGGWLVAILILITTFCVPNSDVWNFAGAHGSADYRNVIAAVKKLHGKVICPEDPTIMIVARGEPGRCLEVELDALGRPGAVPPGLARDISAATWFIRVHGNFDEFFTPDMMKNLGFERQPSSGPFRKVYSLWKRITPPTSQATTAPTRAKRKIKYPM